MISHVYHGNGIYIHMYVDTHCRHIICIQLTMNHNAPHSMGEMRPPTIAKAGIGWTGSAVTLSSLLSSLTTSPTSQLPCALIVSIFVQHSSSSGYHFWRFGELDTDNSVRQVPFFSFHPLHFILSHQLLLVQL